MTSHRDEILSYIQKKIPFEQWETKLDLLDSLDYSQALKLQQMNDDLQTRLSHLHRVPCPMFIIRAGTTGSGKSSETINRLVDTKLLGLKERDRRHMIHVNIDSLVEHYTDFETEIKRLRPLLPDKTQLQSAIQDRYFARRNILNLENDALLWESLARGLTIDFETTLGSPEYLSSLIQLIHSSFPQYRVVLVFYFVEFSTLATRLRMRNKATERKVEIKSALQLAEKALQNLPLVVPLVDQLIVIDNTPSIPKLPRVMINYAVAVAGQKRCFKKETFNCCGKVVPTPFKSLQHQYCKHLSDCRELRN